MYELSINGEKHSVDVPADMPLLWVLRDVIGLMGTKFGCGIAQCGACTVHLDGQAVRSCYAADRHIGAGQSPPSRASGRYAEWKKSAERLARCWTSPQCGYCQSGQIMSAAALLAQIAESHRRGHQRRPCPATSAAAGRTCASAPPSSRQPRAKRTFCKQFPRVPRECPNHRSPTAPCDQARRIVPRVRLARSRRQGASIHKRAPSVWRRRCGERRRQSRVRAQCIHSRRRRRSSAFGNAQR